MFYVANSQNIRRKGFRGTWNEKAKTAHQTTAYLRTILLSFIKSTVDFPISRILANSKPAANSKWFFVFFMQFLTLHKLELPINSKSFFYFPLKGVDCSKKIPKTKPFVFWMSRLFALLFVFHYDLPHLHHWTLSSCVFAICLDGFSLLRKQNLVSPWDFRCRSLFENACIVLYLPWFAEKRCWFYPAVLKTKYLLCKFLPLIFCRGVFLSIRCYVFRQWLLSVEDDEIGTAAFSLQNFLLKWKHSPSMSLSSEDLFSNDAGFVFLCFVFRKVFTFSCRRSDVNNFGLVCVPLKIKNFQKFPWRNRQNISSAW